MGCSTTEPGRWWKRGWFPDAGWVGGDDGSGSARPMLEPQPWGLLAGIMTPAQSRALVASLQLLVTPAGMLTTDAPSGGNPHEKYVPSCKKER